MWNAGWIEAQAGIKNAGRNINKLRYADDTTFVAESEEVKRLSNIQKTKIMVSSPNTSWKIDGETMETVADFILGGSKITTEGDWSH